MGIHIEETRIERHTCKPMFITALFTIARTWKQPRYPSAGEWIRKLWYIYIMEYYSAIKNKSIWKRNNTLLNNQKITEEIEKEIKICTEMN